MTRVLLVLALVVSLWPAAVIALAADRLLGSAEGDERAASSGAPTTAAARAPSRAAPATTSEEPATPNPGSPDIAGLDALRDETADLVVALNASTAAIAGQPDAILADEALEVEGRIVAWQEANEDTSVDAEFFAALFADIASAIADFATAPSPESKARVDEAVDRQRRETRRDGA
jgi:hypothetical protein